MTDFAKLDLALAMALRTYGGEMHPDDEPVSEGTVSYTHLAKERRHD